MKKKASTKQANNAKIFALFVGAIMVLSAFAGFIFRGGNEGMNSTEIAASTPASVDAFGVQGNLVDSNLNDLTDVLAMSPESTTMAYWIDLDKSQNLTNAAREALPMSYGLSYGDNLYPTKIEKLGVLYFNGTSAEFQWVKPFKVGYDGLVIPYKGYMEIPSSSQFSAVMGMPVLFGPKNAIENVLDVISASGTIVLNDRFTLPAGEPADLQIAGLGKYQPPGTTGGFKEFYIGVTKTEGGYSILAKYLSPDADTMNRLNEIATKYGLGVSSKSGPTEVYGSVGEGSIKDVLGAFLAPSP